ncbi:efflux RND transporter periplasmic adaptor subunit [Winogradskyella psychrotolerans]|uniref:Efflux transporter, RND family, MFP subunit n=3 Tax=Flavobacteriaceae TaxID=49546 RepID=F0REM1_CELLC|nr:MULTISPECIES: efflux RND transporter periplasmic adaptor subunit [Flavobacteriaceae]ADY31036.1 efflux transporter, RND family, MFP subunit [Cellulophaga lytica DSM 7489]AIM62000.1 hemolysin D [Cellulophaga lytica]MBD3890943.1 efflux RND transporter periplasmic adaptor subunit [Olleya marilimosa]MBL7559507.1 efflux RND transporter periplasmic adaptor subunit [Olleya sediminilitoris]MBU2920068.1 efflux RND transporter periplasmic adaptor subunit [Winogradskyella psychrotolerans]
MKNKIYKILTVMVLAIFVSACGNKENHNENDGHSHDEEEKTEVNEEHHDEDEVMLSQQQFDALKMKIDTLALRNMSGYVEANGTLEVPPQNEAAITTVVGANVVSIEVIEGDKVNKGQVVAYLSHPNIIQAQTDYLNAYSNSELAKKNYERQQKLYDAGVGSGANFQKAEAEYQASKAMVNGLEAQLRILNVNTTSVRNGTIAQRIALRSPIEGFVQKVEVKTGQYVEPQTELFEIVNTHHVHADLMVFEKDVYKVQKGQKVNFTVQSIPDAELIAEIYSVSKTFEDNPKAVHVHAEIENKKGNLIPGMYIQGKIQVDNTQTKALPESAIIKEGERYYVFSVEKENDDWSFKPIEVVLGTKDGDWVSVQFTENIESNTKFAYNNAYYLNAEMKKGEAEHAH